MNADDSGDRSKAHTHSDEDLVVGRVIRPHGVQGMLLVVAFTEDIRSVRPTGEILLGPKRVPAVVRSIRPHRAQFLLSIEGCDDLQTADGLRGHDVCIRMDDAQPLPEGVYYHWQILGLTVVSDDGDVLGKLDEILETGANDVYVVHDAAGNELLLPAIESVILHTDLQEGRMVVRLIPGLRTD